MKFGIRLRFALWLVAALLPVGVAAIYVFGQIEANVADRVATDLQGVRRLEAARIESALQLYRVHGENLAAGPHVRDFTTSVAAARENGQQTSVIGGYDGFSQIDAFAPRPLAELAAALQRKTDATTAEVAALRLIGPTGEVLGETGGFDWIPTDRTLIQRVIDEGAAKVGNAYRDGDGHDRVGLAVPIIAADGDAVGALLLENELGPIVDLVVVHEGFGQTSEAHLAQADANGDAEFITLLRFERDAAFTKTVPSELNLPINRSLESPSGRVLFAPDYRGEESILAVQTLAETGWGLVIKIDRAEALAPVLDHRSALRGVAALGLLGVLFGWAAFLDPVARRLRRLADGAERVANGEYATPLDDRRNDEIGSVAKSIDRLATDLATDIAVRTDVEDRLRYQATHDATTQIFNRQHATALMQQLARPTADDAAPLFSLLFMDLDKFKLINDSHGHATGDAVLAITARRLDDVAGDRGYIARWGGDEFVMVLPRMDEADARVVAAQVEHVFVQPIETSTGQHVVGTSIGVSTLAPGDSLGQLLQRADEAMFANKQSRR